MGMTFFLTLLTWIFFRAASLEEAVGYLGRMAVAPYLSGDYGVYLGAFLLAWTPLVIEWMQRTRQHGLQIDTLSVVVRWSCYVAVILGILVFGSFGEQEFIYFQF